MQHKRFQKVNGTYNLLEDITIGGGQAFRDASIVVTVGTNGTFPTINAALTELSKAYPIVNPPPEHITAEIELLDNYVMEEKVYISGMNLGWISIQKDIASSVIVNEEALGYQVPYTAFFGVNAILPAFNVKFSSNRTGADNHSGLEMYNCSCSIGPFCGFNNFKLAGIKALQHSRLVGVYSHCNGNTINIYLNNSDAYLNSSNLTNAIENPQLSGYYPHGLIVEDGSTVFAAYANCTNAQPDANNPDIFMDCGIVYGYGISGTCNIAPNTLSTKGIFFK